MSSYPCIYCTKFAATHALHRTYDLSLRIGVNNSSLFRIGKDGSYVEDKILRTESMGLESGDSIPADINGFVVDSMRK
jgi:hypothetical protein